MDKSDKLDIDAIIPVTVTETMLMEEIRYLRGLLDAWWSDPDNPPAAPPWTRSVLDKEK